jgi:hypothetical protein
LLKINPASKSALASAGDPPASSFDLDFDDFVEDLVFLSLFEEVFFFFSAFPAPLDDIASVRFDRHYTTTFPWWFGAIADQRSV